MQNKEEHTKYYILKEYIIDEIQKGRIKPGEKILSENALASKFSLSRHTVRKAISILVTEGYLMSEQGRGTFCTNRFLKGKGTKNIGVMTTYISEYIFPQVIKGIDSILSEKGYSLFLKNTDNDVGKENICLKDMLDRNLDGLIIEPTKSALPCQNLELYKSLDRRSIPYIFIHGFYKALENKPKIILDDKAGMYAATQYLIKLGHSNIIGIFKKDDMQGLDRHKGYSAALSEYGIPYDSKGVIWFNTDDRETKPIAKIRNLIQTGHKIDAVLCYNDEIASKIYKLITEMGLKIPEDISIIGFDDSYLSENLPVRITTLAHPKEELGERAAELLIRLIEEEDGSKIPVQERIVPKFIVKDSCKERI